jgi:protein-tyrosine-phosphatase
VVISLTPEAQHRAVEIARGRSAEIEYWPTFDPTLTEGSREAQLAAYRTVRDLLQQRIKQRFSR